jgi:hypothetical protein
MQTMVNHWEATHGKKASPEDLKVMLNEVKMNRVRVKEWGRDPEKPVITLGEKDIGKAYVIVGGKEVNLAEIPSERRAQAIEALKQRNRPVTEQAIAELWVTAGKPK